MGKKTREELEASLETVWEMNHNLCNTIKKWKERVVELQDREDIKDKWHKGTEEELEAAQDESLRLRKIIGTYACGITAEDPQVALKKKECEISDIKKRVCHIQNTLINISLHIKREKEDLIFVFCRYFLATAIWALIVMLPILLFWEFE